MKLFYGIVVLLSVLLAFVCLFIVRKKNLYLSLLFVSVAVCNTGYFMLSVSKTLTFAIVSNDIAYLGSVFLPFLMLMMIFSLCGIKISKKSAAVFICIGVAVLFIAVTPGILPIYYKSAVLETVNGATALVKEYGPLHFIYALYVALFCGYDLRDSLFHCEKNGCFSQIPRVSLGRGAGQYRYLGCGKMYSCAF